MIELTQKQADVFDFIKLSISNDGIAPSRAEIGDHLGVWPTAAQHHVNALIKKGALQVTAGRQRSTVPVKGVRYRVREGA